MKITIKDKDWFCKFDTGNKNYYPRIECGCKDNGISLGWFNFTDPKQLKILISALQQAREEMEKAKNE